MIPYLSQFFFASGLKNILQQYFRRPCHLATVPPRPQTSNATGNSNKNKNNMCGRGLLRQMPEVQHEIANKKKWKSKKFRFLGSGWSMWEVPGGGVLPSWEKLIGRRWKRWRICPGHEMQCPEGDFPAQLLPFEEKTMEYLMRKCE